MVPAMNMNKRLRACALGSSLVFLAWGAPLYAQEMPPPPPKAMKSGAKGQPFDPDQTREATPAAPLRMPIPATLAPQAPRKPLTVLDAVAIALQLQPDVLVARAGLLQAEGSTQQQRAALMPQAKVRSQYDHQSTPVTSLSGTSTETATSSQSSSSLYPTTTDSFQHGATLSMLLFDFGHTRDLVLQSDLRQKSAAAAVLRSENDAALQIKERFYVLLQKRGLLKVSEDDLANRQEQLRLARALYRAGNRSPGDVVRAQTSVSNSVFALNNARRDLEYARQDLAQRMGLPPLTPLSVEVESEPDLKNKDVAYLLDRAQKQRPDILVALSNLKSSQAGLEAALTTNWPSLSSQAAMNYQGPSHNALVPTFSLQLALDFSLYDGGVRAGSIKTAQGVVANNQAELTRTQLAAEAEVVGAGLALLTAERNLEATKAAVDSALEGVRIARGRYQAALGTVTDVFDSQGALVEAQQNHVNSSAELNIARSRMRHALAEPFDAPIAPVNGSNGP